MLRRATFLSTENFLQTLRHFIPRTGQPHKIYSGNGTNLVSVNNELSLVDWKQTEKSAVVRKFTWKYNLPSTPWKGDFWERF